ncbi:MAG: hypothetical protein E6G75_04280 [Alphaproteobacteria bacterium]|nr:MAG: hypothetical protein E6G75_04280 [Alphaproteobacteria bacterium]
MAARPLGGAFVVILRVAILALGLEFRGCRPLARRAAPRWATQAGVLHPNSWSLPRVAWLVMAALVLMIGSFVVLAQWGGSPPGSTYVPAHIEDGQFVPGETK